MYVCMCERVFECWCAYVDERLRSARQTRKGKSNMRIERDSDPDSKAEETRIERDYVKAKPIDDTNDSASEVTAGDTSGRRWAKLQAMMGNDRPGEREPRQVSTSQLSPSERRRIVVKKAQGLNKAWAEESDMIFGDDTSSGSHQPAPRSHAAAVDAKEHRDGDTGKEEMERIKGVGAELRGLGDRKGAGVQTVLRNMHKMAHRLEKGGDGQAAERALEEGLDAHDREDEMETAR